MQRLQLLVVCGGRTKEDYFKSLNGDLRNTAVKVKFKEKGCHAPKGMVEYAREIASAGGDEFDEVWCVVDADGFNLEPAKTLADKLGVQLAVSNPCFELWLLLHHREHRAFLCDEEAAKRELRRHVHRYNKNDLRFPILSQGWRMHFDVPST